MSHGPDEQDGRDDPKLTIRAKRIKQERDRHEQYKAQYDAYVEKKIEKGRRASEEETRKEEGRGSAAVLHANNWR